MYTGVDIPQGLDECAFVISRDCQISSPKEISETIPESILLDFTEDFVVRREAFVIEKDMNDWK